MSKPSNNKTLRITLLLTIVIVTGLIIFGSTQRTMLTEYYKDLTKNTRKKGDKLKVSDLYYNFDSDENIQLMRLVVNKEGDYMFCLAEEEISVDSMKKYRTRVAAKYVTSKIVHFKFADEKKGKDTSGYFTLYQIIPEAKITRNIGPVKIYDGYSYADNAYYFTPLQFYQIQ